MEDLMTLQCPICHVESIREVLEEYEVETRRGKGVRVGGLQVLTCSNGHIFFIRKSDVCLEQVFRAAA
jgi:hypothetical protein